VLNVVFVETYSIEERKQREHIHDKSVT